jgi:hypothetical protein
MERMSIKPLIVIIAVSASASLASCSWPLDSNWHLIDEGYSIDAVDRNEFMIEMHLNQLKELGGEIRGAKFHSFVFQQLKSHGLCPSGWELLPCVENGSCIQRTRRSVTVPGRCTAP